MRVARVRGSEKVRGSNSRFITSGQKEGLDMEISIDALRKEGRPLWMTEFAHECYAELVGGGGDVYSDRFYPEWMRDFGAEDS